MTPRTGLRALAALLAFLTPALLGGPAAAQFMSPQDESRIGAEQHPEILEEFGGAYPDPELTRYVENVGRKLVGVSDTPNQRYTFTVLNSSVVNAFALPGGYVYVTRALVTLANNEAELAGVMAHEIGHVVARHGAERYNQALLAQIFAAGAGIALGDAQAAQMFGAAAAPLLASYSRQQELEADTFGVRYLARANYDPLAMATFLRHLGAHGQLQDRILGRSSADRFSLLATHPRTPERVQQAIQQANVQSVPAPDINSWPFLQAIDEVAVDGDRTNGFLKERTFVHPQRRFTFELARAFRPVMSDAEGIVAMGPEDSFLQVDWKDGAVRGSMTDYIRREWAPNAQLENLQRLDVNGLEGATATTRANTDRGVVDVRLVALRSAERTIHRMMFVTPTRLTQRLDDAFRHMTWSFRRLTVSEARSAEPLRIDIIQAGPRDTIESLAARLPYQGFKLSRFRVLNGLPEGRGVAPGQYLKMVVD